MASATSAGSVSTARYSRLLLGGEVLAFIVMIQACAPSSITHFSCVYVKAGFDHTTAIPAAVSWLYAGVFHDFEVVEPSRMTCTSSPAFLRAMSALTTLELFSSYIAM